MTAHPKRNDMDDGSSLTDKDICNACSLAATDALEDFPALPVLPDLTVLDFRQSSGREVSLMLSPKRVFHTVATSFPWQF